MSGEPGAKPNQMMKDMIMKVSRTLLAAAFALASLSAAEAEGLRPIQSQTVDLGDLSGVAYYTVERDGFHVVATLAPQGEDAAPLRVETVLAPGQKITFSTPRGPGSGPVALEISRWSDQVLVRKAAALVN
jgi:hypothetical protein